MTRLLLSAALVAFAAQAAAEPPLSAKGGAEPAETPASSGTADAIPPAEPPASRAASSPSGCPKALLREMLAEASDGTGTIAALAIEREALALCARREEAVKRVLALEGEVRALLPRPAVPPASVAEPRRTPPPRPSWGWFTVLGAGDRLRAGVTDGRRTLFVRPGDRLPDGTRIGAIRPSGAVLAEGAALPHRPPPGRAP